MAKNPQLLFGFYFFVLVFLFSFCDVVFIFVLLCCKHSSSVHTLEEMKRFSVVVFLSSVSVIYLFYFIKIFYFTFYFFISFLFFHCSSYRLVWRCF